MQGIPHYLVDELKPWDEFHVVRFQQMAKKAMEQIYANGHIPIIVGGTGFYIQALLYDIDFTSTSQDDNYRQDLENLAKEKGAEYLHNMLREIDPKSAEDIHANNIKRVIRALEYYHQTGQKMSRHNEEERQKESPYEFVYFVLNAPREQLYQRIDRRVDQMMSEGLVEEVKRLKEMGCTKEMVSMQGLGYKEILAYLDGESPCWPSPSSAMSPGRLLSVYPRQHDPHGQAIRVGLPCGFAEENRGCYPISCCGICAR